MSLVIFHAINLYTSLCFVKRNDLTIQDNKTLEEVYAFILIFKLVALTKKKK